MGRDALKDKLVEKYRQAERAWLKDETECTFDEEIGDFFEEFEMYFDEYFPIGN